MNEKHKEIASKILKIIGIGSLVVASSLLNPQFPYEVLKDYLKKEYKKQYTQKQLENAIRYLKQKRFIAYTNGEFSVTEIGRERLELAMSKELVITKIKWDHKWRFVTFDIPEEMKSARFTFRRRLKELGFYNFQRSLFVNPYPCEQEITTLTEILQITPHVHIFVAERFTHDTKLARHFSLLH
jgi:hypothetical protein